MVFEHREDRGLRIGIVPRDLQHRAHDGMGRDHSKPVMAVDHVALGVSVEFGMQRRDASLDELLARSGRQPRIESGPLLAVFGKFHSEHGMGKTVVESGRLRVDDRDRLGKPIGHDVFVSRDDEDSLAGFIDRMLDTKPVEPGIGVDLELGVLPREKLPGLRRTAGHRRLPSDRSI